MRRFWIAVAVGTLVLLAAAWWPAAAALHPLEKPELARLQTLRSEARDLLAEQRELSWKQRTTGERVDVAGTYRGHEALFSLDTLLFLSRAITKLDHDRQLQRAVELLRRHVLRELVALRLAELDNAAYDYLAGATFSHQGKKHPYYALRGLLADEADPAARTAISRAAAPVLRQANALLRKKQDRLRRLSRELGYADPSALMAELRDINLDKLAATCAQFLSRSEKLYQSEFAWSAPLQLGGPATATRREDLPRLVAGVRFADRFTAEEAWPRLENTLTEMGLPFGSLKIDDADRPRKNPHATCYPVAAPDDVRLTFIPAAGQPAYRALWFEMGRAQAFVNTKTPLWEFQQLGDDAALGAFASLFEDLLDNPRFATRHLDVPETDLRDYSRFAVFRKLLLVRRHCAKVLYERDLYRGAPDPAQRYRYWLGQAYGIELDADDGLRHLVDVEDFLAGAAYVRAWFLAATLDHHLTKSYGDAYFTSVETGAFLKGLWRSGRRATADEIAHDIDGRNVGSKHLWRQLKRRAKGRF